MKNSSASNSGAVIFTILFSAALLYTNGIVSPALATIGQAFPDKSAETVQLIYSIPKIMLFICSLLSGVIASRLSIKKCMVLGCVFQALGTLPAWFGGFGFLLFSRVLFGIGYGLIFPMVSAAITDLFSGDKRTALMGIKSAVGSIFSIIMQMLGGYLVTHSWRMVFLEFLIAVPVFFFVLFFLPDTGPKGNRKQGYNLRHQTGSMWLVLLFAMLVMLLANAFFEDVSFVVKERGIGTPKQAGAILSVFSACSCAAGFGYVLFQKFLRRYTAPVTAALMGASLLIAFFSRNLPLMYAAAALYGLGFGLFNPGLALLVADRSRAADEVPECSPCILR